MILVLQLGVDIPDDLANVDLGTFQRHTAYSPSTRHLVDVDGVKGVGLHSNVKAIFATAFYHVLVGINMGSLQGFRGELLIFIWHHVARVGTRPLVPPPWSKMQMLNRDPSEK